MKYSRDGKMEKTSPKREWFDRLSTVGLVENLSWIYTITGDLQRVVSIGCWTSEPFALLWVTNATELTVIELNPDYIKERQEEYDHLKKQIPEAFEERSINLINDDITSVDVELDDFDLAYCENVLYNFQDEEQLLDEAITQMVKLLKINGLLIANEPKYGVEFKMVESILGPMPIPTSDPKDISAVFEKFALKKVDTDRPYWTYVYRKTP